MAENLEQYLTRTIRDLPAIPTVASRVMKAVEDPDATIDDIRGLIDQDPALAVRILKVANSALYGFLSEITNLRHAISLIGMRSVRNLVFGMSMKQTYKHFGLMEKLLWEHATLAGPLAAELAKMPQIRIDPEVAFVAGLLHDVGKVALSNSHHDEYQQVMARVYNEKISFVQAELEHFGFDHAELGARVAEKWKLPALLVCAIRHHHDSTSWFELEDEEARLTALTSMSTDCLSLLGVGRQEAHGQPQLSRLPAWQFLGIPDNQSETVLENCTELVERSKALLQ